MTPIDIAQSVLLAAFASVASYAAYRKRNHIEVELRAQLDQALEENQRLQAEGKRLSGELHAAELKLSPDLLVQYAAQAVSAAEQLGGTPGEKLRKALDAARALDAGDNGRRDWSDAQLRIAIEAEVGRRKSQ